ncbi:hypothetical protein SAMN06264364_101160 [Quadrisphaera granulorum]|uniref:Mannosyltransferase PIG-V n=1 Tax=Quadrisphaera granulorum TaxID=317664 RepID=A0A316AEI0_9ACTN|nr:hypothetical protein [Quadrisphaera granulorum]PWJ56185.1 hypothetical protein BXY45_101160 [Quadrisphaera granulorum]SZE94819.1 hypothetical protein SAMN06264364_101160 [Quadrisphaera granulorum]
MIVLLDGLLSARQRAGSALHAAGARAWLRFTALPGWAQALLLYAATRVFAAAVTVSVARFQEQSVWTPASPSYPIMAADLWDATWYRKIAEGGYPLPLPRSADGAAAQSEWAFFPAYPLLVRLLMTVTGGSWEVVAPTTALLLGAAAAVVLRRLFARVAGEQAALAGLLLVLCAPAAPVLQYAYTESLALLALAWALLTLVERRYGWCVLAVLLLGATRAVALPFALVVLVHAVARWRAEGRSVTLRDRFALLGLLVASGVAGLAWPVAVGVATGIPDAYTEVQSAWRSGQVVWVVPWLRASSQLFGDVAGPVLLVAALAALVWWCTGPAARSLGPELPAWVLAQQAYLLVVLDPWTSLFRYLLLQVPVALLIAVQVRSRAAVGAWAVAGLALQVVWVAWLWRFSPPSDWPP